MYIYISFPLSLFFFLTVYLSLSLSTYFSPVISKTLKEKPFQSKTNSLLAQHQILETSRVVCLQTRGLDPTTQPPTITTTNILSTASKVMKPNDWNGKEFRLAPRINPNPEYNFVHPTLHPNVFVLPSSEEVVDLGNMFDHSDALQTTTQASREPRPTLASSVSAASKMTEASTTLMKESETRKVETTTVTREEEATTEWEEETTPRRRFRYVTKKPRVHS